ncbi:ribonuclease H-like domain-containing protein [Tanacetum coccineum]
MPPPSHSPSPMWQAQNPIPPPITPQSTNDLLALKDPHWCNAMYDEYNALVKNGTWILIPRPPGANMVYSMWLFKHKFHADALLQHLIDSLHREFDMTDLGALNYFLGISADLREPFLAALKRILRYVHGTLDLGLHLYASSTTSLVGYTDVDWAGCPSTRSVEAEYRGVANVVAETAWLLSAVYMSANPVQHQRTKHIEIDIHFVRDMVTAGQVRDLHVPSHFQYADIFTNGLPSALFEEFRSNLSVRPPPAPTARAY